MCRGFLPLEPVILVVNVLAAISQAVTGRKQNEKKPANVLDKFC
jgi:hypothetical protein